MAKKPYADIPGFKKLDAALRDAASAHQDVLAEVAASRRGPRTEAELTALAQVEATTIQAMQTAKAARHALWEHLA